MSDIEPVERTLDIGDAVIDYLDYECGGPPLLLLHATGFMPRLWHPVAKELFGSFRVIAPYFCAPRDSDPEKGGLSWKQIAEDLVAFCRRLGIARPYVAGHSMGGAVAVIAAGALGMEMEGMVLIEPIILPESFYNVKIGVDDHPLASKSIRRRNHWKTREEAMQYLESKPLFQRWDKEVLELYIQYGMVDSEQGGLCLDCHPRQEASLFMGSMHYNPWQVIPKISCPVLVLEGENTENRGFIDFKKPAGLFARGRHQVVADAGHLIPMEKPGETAFIIKRFLRHER
ncbi:MAG: alpha/beta fold hydrolase [Desulfobacterales bacterium]